MMCEYFSVRLGAWKQNNETCGGQMERILQSALLDRIDG